MSGKACGSYPKAVLPVQDYLWFGELRSREGSQIHATLRSIGVVAVALLGAVLLTLTSMMMMTSAFIQRFMSAVTYFPRFEGLSVT